MDSTDMPDGCDWRDSERAEINYPAYLVFGRARIPARIRNVSARGLRFNTRPSQEMGQIYVLEVRTVAGASRFDIITRWDSFEGDHFVTGAELVDGSPENLAAWQHVRDHLSGEAPSDEFYGQPVRNVPRIISSRPVLFSDRHAWVKGSLHNVGEDGTGAFMQAAAQYPPRDLIQFRVLLDGVVYTFQAQTTWSKFTEGVYQFGVLNIQPVREDEPLPAEERPAAEPQRGPSPVAEVVAEELAAHAHAAAAEAFEEAALPTRRAETVSLSRTVEPGPRRSAEVPTVEPPSSPPDTTDHAEESASPSVSAAPLPEEPPAPAEDPLPPDTAEAAPSGPANPEVRSHPVAVTCRAPLPPPQPSPQPRRPPRPPRPRMIPLPRRSQPDQDGEEPE